eukprot:758485-Hanusia_phi.AAC.4
MRGREALGDEEEWTRDWEARSLELRKAGVRLLATPEFCHGGRTLGGVRSDIRVPYHGSLRTFRSSEVGISPSEFQNRLRPAAPSPWHVSAAAAMIDPGGTQDHRTVPPPVSDGTVRTASILGTQERQAVMFCAA